ncbi:unnamed protein product [Rhizoctonia solani]|uniref:Peptidase S8/S53 domain-containing protein n=1 Tax=Rhizoctonia solani TaxID=456999 RepID=A0A8H3BC87_9AGAM|nr:unnamed protein product [Rhizoctonia solani]
MRTAFVISALAFIVPALGAPTIIPITKRAGPVKSNSYIVQLKDGVASDSSLAMLKRKLAPGSSITYNYAPLWNGFAATLNNDGLKFVQRMSEVALIEQDSIRSLAEYEDNSALGDISPAVEHYPELVGRAETSGGSGKGAIIYGIDTGIYTQHNCFGGRAKPGKSFVDVMVMGESDTNDGNGHGTHTAGTAVGKGYGIAQYAIIVAVKVLNAQGSGPTSGVMAGIKWAYDDFKAGNKLAVATMSLGGRDPLGQDTSIDKMVQNAIAGGLHFTIAAGNDGLDAGTTTPARVDEANTIGAVDMKNQRAYFSNFGPKIDVWAPGVNIKSAWIGKPDAENTISGTSMATPYVAGILVNALDKYGSRTPAELSQDLKDHAKPVVTGGLTSNNLLATPW